MMNVLKGLCFSLISALSLLSIAGCATTPAPEKDQETVFYPSPPDLPRIQYLTSFTGSADIEPGKSAFDSFVTGDKRKNRELVKAYGVSMHDGKIYVCDTNVSVMVLDLEKKTFSRLEGAKGMGKVVQPINISITPDGTKYVADPVRGQVVMYDANDFFVKAFGAPGTWKPVDAVADGKSLYVADIKNKEIKVFDVETGQLLRSFGQQGEAEHCLGLPTNLTLSKSKELYVSDAGRFQILSFDRDGHYLGAIGKLGQGPGTFARPKGVAVDNDGRIYAVDAAFDNIQIFESNGHLLMGFGKSGKKGDLFLPAEVAIDYDNVKYFQQYADPHFEIEYLILATSQFGKKVVNVYGYGRDRTKDYPTYEELQRQATKRLKELAGKEEGVKQAEN